MTGSLPPSMTQPCSEPVCALIAPLEQSMPIIIRKNRPISLKKVLLVFMPQNYPDEVDF